MKIIINKKQLNNIIYESKGHVDIFDDFIIYLYDYIYRLLRVSYNMSMTTEDAVEMLNREFNNDDYTEITQMSFNDDLLKVFGINFVNKINVSLFYSNENLGGFNPNSIYINDNKISSFDIDLNIIIFFMDKDEAYDTISHELTHAYEACQTIYKKSNGNNSYIENKKNIVNNTDSIDDIDYNIKQVIYVMSSKEINANISSLYTRLKSLNANENNYENIVKNSGAYDNLKKLEMLKTIFNNNKMNIVNKIYEMSKLNKYRGIFPSSNKLNINRYRKKLIRAVEYKENKMKNKINRVIKYYLNKKSQ